MKTWMTKKDIIDLYQELLDNKKIKIQIPRFENFVHKIYINLARLFYNKPLLFE